MRLRPFILCFNRTAFTVQKSGLKSLAFRPKSFPQISPKNYRHNAVSNRFLFRFSTSRTNGPRLPSPPKAGTHSPSLKKSHTAAYTAKQGPSLPRPQHSLELPAKSLPKEQPEEADARLWRVSASSGVAAPLGCVIFSVSVEIAACMPCAQGLSVCARRGVVSLPSARFTCC